MNWIQKNFKTLIYSAFLVPILTVAIVSISHVTKWYGISNPVSWAVYLSVGVEIAALSALAAISAQMGKKVYFPSLHLFNLLVIYFSRINILILIVKHSKIGWT